MVSSEHFTACSLLGLPGYENSPKAVLNVDLNLNTQLLVPAWRCGSRGWLCGCQEPGTAVSDEWDRAVTSHTSAPWEEYSFLSLPVCVSYWEHFCYFWGGIGGTSWFSSYTAWLWASTVHPFSWRLGNFWTSTHSQSESLFLLEIILCVSFILSVSGVSICVYSRLTFKYIHVVWAEWRTGMVIVQWNRKWCLIPSVR